MKLSTDFRRVTLMWGEYRAFGSIHAAVLPERLDSTTVELFNIGRDRQPPPIGNYAHEGGGIYRIEGSDVE